jgi:23S rRNA (adenine2503-C2)-methyltransferase
MSDWSSVRRIDSTDKNVAKYVFEKGDAVAESVLYKYPTYHERTVICCSTQSGCPVGCRFCGAGDSFVRSLTSDEIVSQPVRLLADTGVDPAEMGRLQIMFMSMGEPMLNMRALDAAIRELHQRYPRAALLVSTSGPRVDYAPFRQLSREVPTVGLQFSVHESTDAGRDALIPFKQKLTLREIAEEGERWVNETGRSAFFNYCAHPGNVSWQDAQNLLGWFSPSFWNATISVVCERDEHVAAANARQRELAEGFRDKLAAWYDTRVFDPAGQDDIGGGCGQLWFVQDWMKSNPDKARPSVGRGLVKLHAPREDALLSAMQTREARRGMEAAFDASPEEMGRAAVSAAANVPLGTG